jgi:4-alpha-glucanotransferase
MIVHFLVRFYTKTGQYLSISGNAEALGNNDHAAALKMEYLNNDFWQVTTEIDQVQHPKIQYQYILTNADGFEVIEWGNDRVIDLSRNNTEKIQVIDTWNHAGSFENAFYTVGFTQTLMADKNRRKTVKSPKHFNHIFRVKAPLLGRNEVVCILGSSESFNNWSAEDPLLLNLEGNWWTARKQLTLEQFPLEYKYAVYNTKDKAVVRLEQGSNRYLAGNAGYELTILHDGFIHLPNNTWKAAGVAVPVFSLRTRDSFGVGEFTDIKRLVDWATEVNIKLIQLLPVNDTDATHTWTDSYPYAAISAFALHPIYLNLEEAAGKHAGAWVKAIRKKQKQLNELPQVDYEQVMQFKMTAARELFDIGKEHFLKDEGFLEFFSQNKHWLVPYAAFCYLRDKNGTADFSQWKIYSTYDKAAIEKYVAPKARHYDEIALRYFIQYHLHLQLKESSTYAHKNGVVLKGDIPIGIYRYSCDAWMAPQLYNMNVQAGAPPDSFAVKGQNWGFPTYNWKKMAEDGYAWWKQRFAQMSEYFDAFRIDHILGFFRIWSVPVHAVEGIMGYFDPAIPVHADEFSARHIAFDKSRYTSPLINDSSLTAIAGDLAATLRENYLEENVPGMPSLKPGFKTQAEVDAHFKTLESTEENQRLRQALFDIISNVILFEVPGTDSYHFRISMEETTSFQQLDWHTQQQLKDLYINYFFYRQDDFWMKEAMNKLPVLKASTEMLVCGEDLGMVPHCVKTVMEQLGLLSLEIQRMPKDPTKEFFHPNDAPYLSVVTPSTHDMSTIRGWWEEDHSKTQRFYNQQLGQWGNAPYFCEPWIVKIIILQHLYSPAMLSIFQLQDLLAMEQAFRPESPSEERINIPAIAQHYWRYRMPFTLEHLIKEKAFNHELRDFVAASGR